MIKYLLLAGMALTIMVAGGTYGLAYVLTDGTMQVNKEQCGDNGYWKCLLKGKNP